MIIPPAARASAWLILFICCMPLEAQVPGVITGTVRAAGGEPLPGALVAVPELRVEAVTDARGIYELQVPPGAHLVRVTFEGFRTIERNVQVGGPSPVAADFDLLPAPRFTDEVTVSAVRAEAWTPVSKTDIQAIEIASTYRGQEMPYLLQPVPSLTFYSDTGTGFGYAYMSLRGVPQTRMNITLDGAPLNDAEDSALYFVDFGDFASNVESAQVQRGVGTSVPGAASFVGSVNFASVDIEDEPALSARAGAGAFGTGQLSVAGHTGVVGPGLKFYARASWQQSDGFREHSAVDQRSVFFGAARQGDRSFWKVFGFAGHERTELAFLAVEEAVLEENLRANPLSPDERDSFGQQFMQAQYHRAIGASGEWSVQGYVNAAGGWYRLWDDPTARNALLQYGLDWRMIGMTSTARGRWRGATLTWGLHANDFRSRHTQDVVDGTRNYSNRGRKNEVSTFGRAGIDAGRWHHYADAQVRWARFVYDGDLDLGGVSWTFFNPKLGTRYDLSRGASLYASIGRAIREPTRSDLFSGEDNPTIVYDLRAVKPERVVDVEAGFELQLRSLALQANAYSMQFRDEIAMTGELSEIGLPLRRNVDRSYRRGVEIDATWRPTTTVRVRHTANVGRSRISSWTQYYDVYGEAGDYAGAVALTHEDVSPLLTPAYVGNLAIDWQVRPWAGVGANGRYVSKAHLDNTGNGAFTTPGWFNLDVWAAIRLSRFVRAGSPILRLNVINLLDNDRLFPSGYSYQYFVRDLSGADHLQGTSYYYPMATRGVFVALELSK